MYPKLSILLSELFLYPTCRGTHASGEAVGDNVICLIIWFKHITWCNTSSLTSCIPWDWSYQCP
jgi:hypothetical protein